MDLATAEKKAEKFERQAQGLQDKIAEKFNGLSKGTNMTRKRLGQVEQKEMDGRWLKKVQRALYGIAAALREDRLPKELALISHQSQVQDILRSSDEHPMKKALLRIMPPEQEDTKELKIQQAERALFGHSIPGFFPTPPAVVEKMMNLACLYPGVTILEPEAGRGDIPDVGNRHHQNLDWFCVEYNQTLSELLKLKGYRVMCFDFLELRNPIDNYPSSFPDLFDRILMNPPFEKSQDIEHITHAYWKFLRPGGWLVSVISEGTYFRQTKKTTEFLEWTQQTPDYCMEKLPAGSFRSSFCPTDVACRLIRLGKP